MAYDWGKGLSGMLSGGAAGSAGGPIGALAGGLLGGLTGFGKKKDKMKKVETLTPEQKKLLNQILSFLGPQGMLGEGYEKGINQFKEYMNPSSESLSAFTEPYMRQFNQQTIPGLAEQFAGANPLGGGLSSSGFGQALGAAGGNLQAVLAQLKAGLGMQAAQNLMGQYGGMLSAGLGTPAFAYQQKAPTAGQGFLSSWGKAGFPGMSKIGSYAGDLYQDYMPIIGNV